MIRLLLFFSILSISCLTFAQEAEAPALTQKEAKALFDRANKELNTLWSRLKKELSEDDFLTLQEEQRGWLDYRQQSAAMMSGSEEENAEFLEVAAGITEERAAYLNGLIDESIDHSSLTGVWGDSYGGTLEIVEKDDGTLYFNIDVVRGPTMHLGQLSGVGKWNNPIGWFSDEDTDESREDITNLAFVLRGNKLEVIGANTHYYHGARGYFDGHYVKTRSLSEEETKQVIKTAEDGPEEG